MAAGYARLRSSPDGYVAADSELRSQSYPALKAALIEAWPKAVADKITATQHVNLEGKFAEYVDAFDFSIFQRVSPREVIEKHRATSYFIARFGGGLPPRPAVGAPPTDLADQESVYVAPPGSLRRPHQCRSSRPCRAESMEAARRSFQAAARVRLSRRSFTRLWLLF